MVNWFERTKHRNGNTLLAKITDKDGDTTSGKRSQALQAALDKINKEYGAGSAMKLGDTDFPDVEVVPSGSLAIDIALGLGGLPRGRIIEIWGPESSGKTLFCLHAIAEHQKLGGQAAFIDAEHALNPAWAAKIGVNTDELILSQPDNGEQAFEILETLVNSGAVDIIIVDSVAALIPKKELEGDMDDAVMGSQARMMSKGLRKITAAVAKNGVTVIFINQVRSKIGVVFGSPNVTTGGNALKYYATIRMEIARTGQLKDGEEIIGSRTKVKVVKNKVAPPFKQAEFDILYAVPGSEGYSREADIRDLGVQAGIIKKSGAWFTLVADGSQLGQGGEKTRVYLKDNPEVAADLEQQLRDLYLVKKEAKLDEIAAGDPTASL